METSYHLYLLMNDAVILYWIGDVLRPGAELDDYWLSVTLHIPNLMTYLLSHLQNRS
jgi:hypothetical protein